MLRGGAKSDIASVRIPLIYVISNIEYKLEGGRDGRGR